MIGEIINVGTELLMGDTVNSNAQYIGKELSRIGVSVYFHTTVGDNQGRLESVLQQAVTRSDLIILTGGLGPTQDDLTKETLTRFLGLELILHEESLEKIRTMFARLGSIMSQNNVKQALIPEGAIVLENNHGTAPGILLEREGNLFILLPGPPREMIPMFREQCIPYLEEKNPQKFSSRYYKVSGLGESAVEDRLLDLIDGQSNPTIATYAKSGEVLVRVTGSGMNQEVTEELLDLMEKQILDRIGPWVYSREDEELHQTLAKALMKENITISLAESCTGGLLASQLTESPGISSVFHSGIVCYSNEAKMQYLGVKEETLFQYGAVSASCAREMLDGLLKNNKTRAAIATTGIAGPGGGSEEKPVGLVYIGVALDGKFEIVEARFSGNRHQIQVRSAAMAWNLLRKLLIGN